MIRCQFFFIFLALTAAVLLEFNTQVEAAKIVAVNGQHLPATVFIFGNEPTLLSFEIRGGLTNDTALSYGVLLPSTNTGLLLGKGDFCVGANALAAVNLQHIPTATPNVFRAEWQLQNGSLPFFLDAGRRYRLCYAGVTGTFETDIVIEVFPSAEFSYANTNEKTFFAPQPRIAGFWTHKIETKIRNWSRFGRQLVASQVYSVPVTANCSYSNSLFIFDEVLPQFATFSSSSLSSYSLDASVDYMKICFCGVATHLNIRMIRGIWIGDKEMTSSTKQTFHIPLNVQVTFRVQARVGTGTHAAGALNANIAFRRCSGNAMDDGTSLELNNARDSFSVIIKNSYSDVQLCANSTGLLVFLNAAVRGFEFSTVNKILPSLDAAIRVPHLFDASRTWNERRNFWPYTVKGINPVGISLFLASDASCTQIISTQPDAIVQEKGIAFSPSWIHSQSFISTEAHVCYTLGGAAIAIPNLRVIPRYITSVRRASTTQTNALSDKLYLLYDADAVHIRVSGTLGVEGPGFLGISWRCSGEEVQDQPEQLQQIYEKHSTVFKIGNVATGAQEGIFTIPAEMIAAHPRGYQGPLCIGVYTSSNHSTQHFFSGYVAAVTVLATLSVGQNGAMAAVAGDTHLPIRLPYYDDTILSALQFHWDCAEQKDAYAMNAASAFGPAIPIPLSTRGLRRLCWKLSLPGSDKPNRVFFIAEIFFLPSFSRTTSPQVFYTFASSQIRDGRRMELEFLTEFAEPLPKQDISIALFAGKECNGSEARPLRTSSQRILIPNRRIGVPVAAVETGTLKVCAGLMKASEKVAFATFPYFVGELTAVSLRLNDQSSEGTRGAYISFPLLQSIKDKYDFAVQEEKILLNRRRRASRRIPSIWSSSVSVAAVPAIPSGSLYFFLDYPTEGNYRSCQKPRNTSASVGPYTGLTSTTATFDLTGLLGPTSVSAQGNVPAAMSTNSQTLCVAFESLANSFAVGVNFFAFSLITIDEEPVVFGAGSASNTVKIGVFHERRRVASVEGINMQSVLSWNILLSKTSQQTCSAGFVPDLSIPFQTSPEGSRGQIVLPTGHAGRYSSACLAVTEYSSVVQYLNVNVELVTIPFRNFDGSVSTMSTQQRTIVGVLGLRAFIYAEKASKSLVLPFTSNDVEFVYSSSENLTCSTIIPGTYYQLSRSIDASGTVALSFEAPKSLNEGYYSVCALVSHGGKTFSASLGVKLIALDVTVSGISIRRGGGTLTSPVGNSIELHASAVSSSLLDYARLFFAFSERNCQDPLKGMTAIGISRNFVEATGCSATGVVASFSAPTSSTASLGKPVNICFAATSSDAQLSGSSLRFQHSGIRLAVYNPGGIIKLRMKEPLSRELAQGTLSSQPILQLFDHSTGLMYSSLPVDIQVAASWIPLDDSAFDVLRPTEKYRDTFKAGEENIDFSRHSTRIGFFNGQHYTKYVLNFVATAEVEIPSLNSSETILASCSSQLWAKPYSSTCWDCPLNAVCNGSTSILVSQSMYRPSRLTSKMYPCSEPYGAAGCLAFTELGTCKTGYVGPRCTECQAGYGKETTGECSKCPSRGLAIFIVILAIFAIIYVIVVIGLMVAATYRTPKGEPLQTYVKILLNFITVGGVMGEMGRYYPPFLKTFFRIELQVSQPSPDFPTFRCGFSATWYDMFIVANFLPLMAIVVALIGTLLYRFFSKEPEEDSDDLEYRPENEKPVKVEPLSFGHFFAMVMIATSFVFYPTLVSFNIRPFRCESIDASEPTPTGGTTGGTISYFYYDRTKLCDSSEHKGYQAAGIFFLLLWGLGIPACYVCFYALLAFSKNGNYVTASRMFTFLVAGYQRLWWWWESVIMLRKFLLIVIVTYVSGASLQSLLCSWVIGACLIAHVYLEPFEYQIPDLLERLELLVLFVTISATLLFDLWTNDTSSDNSSVSVEGHIVAWIILLLHVGVTCCILFFIIPDAVRQFRRMLHNRRFSLRRYLPDGLATLLLKISLPDISPVKVIIPGGQTKIILQREEDLISDWDDESDGEKEEEPTKESSTNGNDHVSPVVAFSASKHAAGDRKNREPHSRDDAPVFELPEEDTAGTDISESDTGAHTLSRDMAFLEGKKHAEKTASGPIAEEFEGLESEEEMHTPGPRAGSDAVAFHVGRKAQEANSIMEDLEEIEPNEKKRKELRKAFEQGKFHQQSVASIPPELDDQLPDLTEPERHDRRQLQIAFKQGKESQQASMLFEEMLGEVLGDDTYSAKRRKCLEKAFKKGSTQPAGGTNEIPDEVLFDQDPKVLFPHLDDVGIRQERKNLLSAFKLGREANAITCSHIFEDPHISDDRKHEIHLAFEKGRVAAKRTPAVPEEFDETLPDLSDSQRKERRKMKAIFMQGVTSQRCAQQIQELEESVDDPDVNSKERQIKKLRENFVHGREAQRKADKNSIPNELDETPEMNDVDKLKVQGKRVAYFIGKHTVRLGKALMGETEELAEEPVAAPIPVATPVSEENRLQEYIANLQKELSDAEAQLKEQIETINRLMRSLSIVEAENHQLKDEQRQDVATAGLVEEMNKMLETIQQLQAELEECRKNKKGTTFGKLAGISGKLTGWKDKAKQSQERRKDALQSILRDKEKIDTTRTQLLEAERKAQQDFIKEKLEKKRAAHGKKKGPQDMNDDHPPKHPADDSQTTDDKTGTDEPPVDEATKSLLQNYTRALLRIAQQEAMIKDGQKQLRDAKGLLDQAKKSGRVSEDVTKMIDQWNVSEKEWEQIVATEADKLIAEGRLTDEKRKNIEKEEQAAQQRILQAKLEQRRKKLRTQEGGSDSEVNSLLGRYSSTDSHGDAAAQIPDKIAAVVDVAETLEQRNRELTEKVVSLTVELEETKKSAADLTTYAESLQAEVANIEKNYGTERDNLNTSLEQVTAELKETREKLSATQSKDDQNGAAQQNLGSKSKKWATMSRLMRSDPSAALDTLISANALSQQVRKWSQEIDGALELDPSKDQEKTERVQEIFGEMKEVIGRISGKEVELGEDLARQKRLCDIFKRSIAKLRRESAIANGDENPKRDPKAEIDKLLQDAQVKSAERLEIEKAEQQTQQKNIQDRLMKKREARKQANKAAKASPAGVEELIEALATEPVPQDTVAQQTTSKETEQTLEEIAKDPQKSIALLQELTDLVAALRAESGGLTEKNSELVEKLLAEESALQLLQEKLESSKAEGSADEQSKKEYEDTIRGLQEECESLREKLHRLVTRSQVQNVSTVKRRIQAWKTAADARKVERGEGVTELIQQAEMDEEARKSYETAEFEAQQAAIREHVERKRARRRKQNESGEHVTSPPAAADPTTPRPDETTDDLVDKLQASESTGAVSPWHGVKDVSKLYEFLSDMQGIIEGLQTHSQQLVTRETELVSQLQVATQNIAVLQRKAERMEELAAQSDKALRNQLDEMAELGVTLKHLEEENEGLKNGVADPKSGMTLAEMQKEMGYLRKRILLLETESGTSTANVQSIEVKAKLKGWQKSAQKKKAKREANITELLEDAKRKDQLIGAVQDAEKEHQGQLLQQRLAKKRAATRKNKTSEETVFSEEEQPNKSDSVGVEIQEDAQRSEVVTAVDADGNVLVPPRRHRKMKETAALVVLSGLVAKRSKDD